MKTYLFSIPERLKNKSEELDVQAIICNKTWEVFNDEGTKQVFIFKPDGSLIISVNGIVTRSTWEYLATNKSLLITAENQTMMLHPAFFDEVLFALQVDGTEDCVFMIKEDNTNQFPIRTIKALKSYFAKKIDELTTEQIRLLALEEKKRKQKEKGKKRRLESKAAQEEERRKNEERMRPYISELKTQFDYYTGIKPFKRKKIHTYWWITVIPIPVIILIADSIAVSLALTSTFVLSVVSIILYILQMYLNETYMKRWEDSINKKMLTYIYSKNINDTANPTKERFCLERIWFRYSSSWFNQKEFPNNSPFFVEDNK